MRAQAERDEQTVEIMAAILVAGLAWGVPLIALVVLAVAVGVDVDEVAPVLAAAAAGGFVVTVVRRLR